MDPNIKEFTDQAAKKSGGFVGEFKEFALKGNVIDMAVGIVIGAAFGAIVNSMVSDLITPLVGFLTAGTDFDQMKIVLSDTAAIKYGSFIQSIINFIIIALSIFIVVKIINKFRRNKEDLDKKTEAESGQKEIDVLVEIRDLLKKE